MNKSSNLVAGIYYHPEAYPPTLNAITRLSHVFGDISIVGRPHLKGSWRYPDNVKEILSGKFITSSDQENAPLLRKISFFARFTYDLYKTCSAKKPSVILLYDTNALYAYSLIRRWLPFKHTLWYHNHDIAEIGNARKFSIGWFACKKEKEIFREIDIFTLPSIERLRFFPMDEFKGRYFILPNYPAVDFYNQFYQPARSMEEIKLIFQGRIGEGHGLEEIIPLLAGPVAGRPLKLVLKGHCAESYRQKLMDIASLHGVNDKIEYFGFSPYREVPQVASSCHIGIGIFLGKEVMHVTLGTASNKLYEYAALGLPVIYLGEEYFSRYLAQYEWAIPVELEPASLTSNIENIINNFHRYSEKAHEDFTNELNFEKFFRPLEIFLREGQEN